MTCLSASSWRNSAAKPLDYEGKAFSGAYLMANGLEMPYNHKVDYHKLSDYSSRVLYLEEVK